MNFRSRGRGRGGGNRGGGGGSGFPNGGSNGNDGSGGFRQGGGGNGQSDQTTEEVTSTSVQVVTSTSSAVVTSVITSSVSTEESSSSTEELSSQTSQFSSSTSVFTSSEASSTSTQDSSLSDVTTSSAAVQTFPPTTQLSFSTDSSTFVAATQLSSSTDSSFPSDTGSAMAMSTEASASLQTTSTLNVTKIGLITGGCVFGAVFLIAIFLFFFRRHRKSRAQEILPFTMERSVDTPRPPSIVTFTSRSVAAVNRFTMRSDYILRTPSSSQRHHSQLPTAGSSPERRVLGDEDTLRGDLQDYYVVYDWNERRGLEPARLSGSSVEMDPQFKHQFATLDRELQTSHRNTAGSSVQIDRV